jgi:hypothetical protein
MFRPYKKLRRSPRLYSHPFVGISECLLAWFPIVVTDIITAYDCNCCSDIIWASSIVDTEDCSFRTYTHSDSDTIVLAGNSTVKCITPFQHTLVFSVAPYVCDTVVFSGHTDLFIRVICPQSAQTLVYFVNLETHEHESTGCTHVSQCGVVYSKYVSTCTPGLLQLQVWRPYHDSQWLRYEAALEGHVVCCVCTANLLGAPVWVLVSYGIHRQYCVCAYRKTGAKERVACVFIDNCHITTVDTSKCHVIPTATGTVVFCTPTSVQCIDLVTGTTYDVLYRVKVHVCTADKYGIQAGRDAYVDFTRHPLVVRTVTITKKQSWFLMAGNVAAIVEPSPVGTFVTFRDLERSRTEACAQTLTHQNGQLVKCVRGMRKGACVLTNADGSIAVMSPNNLYGVGVSPTHAMKTLYIHLYPSTNEEKLTLEP